MRYILLLLLLATSCVEFTKEGETTVMTKYACYERVDIDYEGDTSAILIRHPGGGLLLLRKGEYLLMGDVPCPGTAEEIWRKVE